MKPTDYFTRAFQDGAFRRQQRSNLHRLIKIIGIILCVLITASVVRVVLVGASEGRWMIDYATLVPLLLCLAGYGQLVTRDAALKAFEDGFNPERPMSPPPTPEA